MMHVITDDTEEEPSDNSSQSETESDSEDDTLELEDDGAARMKPMNQTEAQQSERDKKLEICDTNKVQTMDDDKPDFEMEENGEPWEVKMLVKLLANYENHWQTLATLSKQANMLDPYRLFGIVSLYPDVFSVTVGESRMQSVIELSPLLKLCGPYQTQGQCSDTDCRLLHLCLNSLLGVCDKDSCECVHGHDVVCEHNIGILKSFYLHELPEDNIKSVILRGSHGTILPAICSNYNKTGCFNTNDVCNKLHVCKDNVKGKCIKRNCYLNHSMEDEQCLSVCARFGVSSVVERKVLTQRLQDLWKTNQPENDDVLLFTNKVASENATLKLDGTKMYSNGRDFSQDIDHQATDCRKTDVKRHIVSHNIAVNAGASSSSDCANVLTSENGATVGQKGLSQSTKDTEETSGRTVGERIVNNKSSFAGREVDRTATVSSRQPSANEAVKTMGRTIQHGYVGTKPKQWKSSGNQSKMGSWKSSIGKVSSQQQKFDDAYQRDNSVSGMVEGHLRERESYICVFGVQGKCRKESGNCQYAHYPQMYSWQMRTSYDKWTDFGELLSGHLENAYCIPSNNSCVVGPLQQSQYEEIPEPILKVLNHEKWYVDFCRWLIVGSHQKADVLIRRLSTPSVGIMHHKCSTKWIWYWHDDDGSWIKYGDTLVSYLSSPATSENLEYEYCNNSNQIFYFWNELFKYEINFKKMKQINCGTRKERTMRRRPLRM